MTKWEEYFDWWLRNIQERGGLEIHELGKDYLKFGPLRDPKLFCAVKRWAKDD